jgi:hypothetical protein
MHPPAACAAMAQPHPSAVPAHGRGHALAPTAARMLPAQPYIRPPLLMAHAVLQMGLLSAVFPAPAYAALARHHLSAAPARGLGHATALTAEQQLPARPLIRHRLSTEHAARRMARHSAMLPPAAYAVLARLLLSAAPVHGHGRALVPTAAQTLPARLLIKPPLLMAPAVHQMALH